MMHNRIDIALGKAVQSVYHRISLPSFPWDTAQAVVAQHAHHQEQEGTSDLINEVVRRGSYENSGGAVGAADDADAAGLGLHGQKQQNTGYEQ